MTKDQQDKSWEEAAACSYHRAPVSPGSIARCRACGSTWRFASLHPRLPEPHIPLRRLPCSDADQAPNCPLFPASQEETGNSAQQLHPETTHITGKPNQKSKWEFSQLRDRQSSPSSAGCWDRVHRPALYTGMQHGEGNCLRGAAGHTAQCLLQTQQQARLGPWFHMSRLHV